MQNKCLPAFVLQNNDNLGFYIAYFTKLFSVKDIFQYKSNVVFNIFLPKYMVDKDNDKLMSSETMYLMCLPTSLYL